MYRISAVILALVCALPAVAADKYDAESRAGAVAPFLDTQTVAVAHVDLTRIDAVKLLSWVAEVGGLEKKEIVLPQLFLRSWLADLTKAGGKEIYVVGSLADLPIEPPLVIVPLAADADAQAVRRVLERINALKELHFETRDQVLFGGSEEARKRLRNAKPAVRPELAKAFAVAGDTTAQLILMPTPDTRRVVEELLPELPPQIGGGSTRPLAQGFRWAVLGVDLPPKPSLRLVIQSPDAASAGQLKELLSRVVRVFMQQAEVRALLPDVDRVTEALTPRVEGDLITLSLAEDKLKAFLPKLVQSVYRDAERRPVENSLHRMVLAMHNYADTHKGRLPAVANLDKTGKPLLSWRVHLLPFLGANELYKQFHLNEPWDSPHNKQLIARMPEVYQGPNRGLNREGKTIFLLPLGKETAFKEGPEGLRLPTDITDGTSNTIFIVEADDAHAVPWTKPADLKIASENPQRGLGGHFRGGFVMGIGDGSVRFLQSTISKTTLWSAFTPAGGEVLGSDW